MTIVAGLSAAEMRPANICRRMRESAVSLKRPDSSCWREKGADDARAGKILAREQRKAIHARLYALVKAQRAGDDQIDDKADERRGDKKDERQLHADGQRHNDGAEYHERRAQQKAQHQIDPRLCLIDVGSQAGDEPAGAEAVEFGVRKRVDVLEQRRAHRRAEAHRRLRRKELRA